MTEQVAHTKQIWPKFVLVPFHPNQPSRIVDREEVARYLDEADICNLEQGHVAGIGSKEWYSIRRYTREDSIRAAAPELLEALKELRSHAVRDIGEFMKACDAADLAIRKAERSERPR